MKKSLLVALFLIVSVSAQEWRLISTESNSGISGIFFSGENIGWAVGDDGLIYKTTDGGDSWEIKFDDADSITYRRIVFANENIGFAGGEYGIIVKTTDGGETWNYQSLPGATGDVNAICSYSENEIWVLVNADGGSKIYYTSNGGDDWQSIYDITLVANDMHFGEDKNGVVVGKNIGEIYYTTDGQSWTKAAPTSLVGNYSRSDIKGVYMVNSSLGYATGWGSLVGSQPTIYLKTTDGGASWSYLSQVAPNLTYQNNYAIYFKDPENGIAVGGGGGAGSIAAKTSDGGLNWIPIDIPCGSDLYSIQGIGDNLWISGDDGVILRSTDFGSSWKLLTEVPGNYLYSMKSLPDNNFVAAGFNGLFIKSYNNGKDWKGKYIRANNVALNVREIFFVNENVGYAGHSYGMLSKTTDGGETWSAVIPNSVNNMADHNGLFFLNENYGFSVGRISSGIDAIYKTTDGGVSWDLKSNVIASPLKSVAFRDENHGIAVGEKLKIIFTTDGGNTWTPSLFVTLPPDNSTPNLTKVVFKDDINAIASGIGIILNSTDGGASWNYINVENLTETITGLCFKDSQTGWAVGTKLGKPRSVGLYKTIDGGTTWTNLVDPSIFLKPEFVNGAITYPLVYDVALQGDNAFVCGTQSQIYTNMPEVVSNNEQMILPNSIYLLQNYPNPFNPSTTIKYSVAGESKVTIRVYDVLGNMVSELINETKPAGEYKINFNAGNLSSGIYFSVMNAGGKIITNKMTLIK